MYSTCLFCRSSLGSNEAIEHFPVGRRLAFDSKNGRLWVVCRSCERWNLSPIEERWEALEECERLFEQTRLRVSTDEIGLARVKEGLELVRIGKPKRPEFAAWRYGDQFGRRRRKHLLLVSGALVAAGGILIGQYGFGLALGGVQGLNMANSARTVYRAGKIGTTINANGEVFALTLREMSLFQLIWSPVRNDWSLLIPRKKIWSFSRGYSRIVRSEEAIHFLKMSGRADETVVEVQGREAQIALGKLMARVNSAGGKTKTIQSAVSEIENSGGPDQLLSRCGEMFAANRRLLGMSQPDEAIPDQFRLAMEMAANEENERNALLGELELLKDEWRAAEEIAAISDNLLVPGDVQKDLASMKSESQKS